MRQLRAGINLMNAFLQDGPYRTAYFQDTKMKYTIPYFQKKLAISNLYYRVILKNTSFIV